MITVLPELLDAPAARSCCSCRSRTSSARSCSARPSTAGPCSATPPTPSTCSTTSATFRPTVLLAVPRVFEKVFHGARRKAVDGGKGKIFDAAAATAVAWSEACDAGGPGAGLRLRRALFDALVYRRLRAALGGQVQAAVSGSAPLTEHLGHFFRGVGVPVLEGYGLTETTRRDLGQHHVRAADRHGRPAHPRADDPHRGRRGDPRPRSDRVPRLPRQPGRHRRGGDRRLVPHR